MHEGHHGIFDDMEDMDDLFGINEEHDHGHHHNTNIVIITNTMTISITKITPKTIRKRNLVYSIRKRSDK